MYRFESQRPEIIANALDCRVIAVELPGVGVSAEAKSSVAEGFGLLTGSFDKSAGAMLDAMNEVAKFKDEEQVELLLYSQGAAIGASMLKVLGREYHGLKLKVPKVTIVEAVNDQPYDLLELLKKINAEDAYTDQYLDENKKYDWLVPPTDRTELGKIEVNRRNKEQQINLLLAGVALRAPFNPVLLRAINEDQSDNTTGISKSQINIFKFDASGVSRLEKNELTVRQIGSAMTMGEAALTVLVTPSGEKGLHHPVWHSMPKVEALTKKF